MWTLYIRLNNKLNKVEFDDSGFVYQEQKYNPEDIYANTAGFSYSFTIPKTPSNIRLINLYLNNKPEISSLVKGVEAVLYNNSHPIFGEIIISSITDEGYKANFKSLQSSIKERLSNIDIDNNNLFGSTRIPLNKEELKNTVSTELLKYPTILGAMQNENWSVNTVGKNYTETVKVDGIEVFKYLEPIINWRELINTTFKSQGINVRYEEENTSYIPYLAVANREQNSVVYIPTNYTDNKLEYYPIYIKLKTTAVNQSSDVFSYNARYEFRIPYDISVARTAGFQITFKTETVNNREVFQWENKPDFEQEALDRVAYPYLSFYIQRYNSSNKATQQLLMTEDGFYSNDPNTEVNYRLTSGTQDREYLGKVYTELLNSNDFSKWQKGTDGHYTITVLWTLFGKVYVSNDNNGYDLFYESTATCFDNFRKDIWGSTKLGTTYVEVNKKTTDIGSIVSCSLFKTIDHKEGYSGGTYLNIGKATGYKTLYDLIEVYCNLTNSFFEFTDFNTVYIYSKDIESTNTDYKVEVSNITFVEYQSKGIALKKDNFLAENYHTYTVDAFGDRTNVEEINLYNLGDMPIIPYAQENGTDKDGVIQYKVRDLTGPTVVTLDENNNILHKNPLNSYQNNYNIQAARLKVSGKMSTTLNSVVNKLIYIPEFSRYFLIYSAKYKSDIIEFEAISYDYPITNVVKKSKVYGDN